MKRYSVGPVQIDLDQRLVYKDGEVVPLQPKEFSILEVLLENAGKLVSRDAIRERVWQDELIEEANLSKKISRLRSALREHLGEDPIKTFSKLGYQFNVPVTVHESAAVAETQHSLPSISTELSAETDGAMDPPDTSRSQQLRPYFRRWAALGAVLVVAVTGSMAYEHGRIHPPAKVEATARPSLAILTFRNLSSDADSDWMGTALQETLGTDLASSDGVRLVSGDQDAKAEQDLALSPMLSYDDKTIQALGKRLNCDFALVGFYLPVDANVRVDLQLRDTKTGAMVGQFSQIAARDNLFQTVVEAGTSLRKDLGLPLMQAAPSNALPNIDTAQDAMRYYAEGLQLLRQDKASEAQPLLSKAVAASPLSPLAHVALAEAWYHMGAEEKAAAESHLALSTDSSLPAQQKLNLEASAYNYSSAWPKAMETYAKLRKLHPDELDYALGFANAQTQAGNPKEALQTLRALSVSSKAAANDPRVSQAESYAASLFNDWRSSLYYAGEALRLARATSSRTLEINALILEGSAWGGLGNTANGIADFESAERLSAASGDLDRLSQALSGLGQLQQEAGDPAAAIVTLRRAVDIDRKVGDRSTVMMLDASLGGALVDVQDWAGARRRYQELLDMAQPAYPGIQPLGLTGLADLAAAMGNFDEERSYANRALILSRKVEDLGDQVESLFDLARINLLYGNVAAAGTQLRQASDIANRLGETDLVADSLRATAQFDIEAGDLVSARKMVDQALAMNVLAGPQLNALLLTDAELKIEEGHPEALEAPITALASRSSVANPGAKAWRLVAESWLLRGDIAKARIAIGKAFALARKSPNSADYLIPDSLVLARIDAAEGHTAQASAELSLLLRESQRVKDLPVQLEIRLAQGKLKKQSGDLAGSTRILQAVQTEATQRGFGLIAQKARQAESAS